MLSFPTDTTHLRSSRLDPLDQTSDPKEYLLFCQLKQPFFQRKNSWLPFVVHGFNHHQSNIGILRTTSIIIIIQVLTKISSQPCLCLVTSGVKTNYKERQTTILSNIGKHKGVLYVKYNYKYNLKLQPLIEPPSISCRNIRIS